MSTEATRRFVARPTGKVDRFDRRAIRNLWSLLYRAVRRQSVRVDQALDNLRSQARRIGNLSTRLHDVERRLTELEGERHPRRH